MNHSKNKALPVVGGQTAKRNQSMKQYSLFKRDKKIKCEPIFKSATPFAGIFPVVRFSKRLGLYRDIDTHLNIKKRKRGYKEADFILSCVYNLLLGGDSLDDTGKLLKDEVFKEISDISVPAPSTQGEFFRKFGIGEIKKFYVLNRELLKKMFGKMNKRKKVILDIDSSIFETYGKKKEGAEFCYNGKFGFHPIFIFNGETGEMLWTKLRRGSSYSSKGIFEGIKESFKILNSKNIKEIYIRADSAFYDKDFVKFLEEKNIKFVICADITLPVKKIIKSIKEDKWKKYKDGQEVSEFEYKPCFWDKPYRFIVKRRKKTKGENLDLFEGEYSYLVIATNIRNRSARWVMNFYEKKSNLENYIKELKISFSLEKLPFQRFFANWTYLLVGQIVYNLFIWAKNLLFPESMRKWFIKRFRYCVFLAVGYIVNHARQKVLKVIVWSKRWWRIFENALKLSESFVFR